jgi:AcrR family transcriptional regulator
MPVLSRTPSEPAREAQEARKAEAEQRILDAVAALVAEGQTFADVSVTQIAERAGFSRSAFYSHFRDKRAVVLRLTEVVTKRIVTEATRWEGTKLQLPGGLPEVMQWVTHFFAEEADVLRALTESAQYDEVMGEWWHGHLAMIIHAVEGRIEREQADGRIEGLRPSLAAASIVWMVQQVCYQEIVVLDRFTPDELADELAVLVGRALGFTSHTADDPGNGQ